METFAGIIDQLGGHREFSRLIGITVSHARTMKTRDSIPVERWPKVVAAAAEAGKSGITYSTLVAIRARTSASPKPKTPASERRGNRAEVAA